MSVAGEGWHAPWGMRCERMDVKISRDGEVGGDAGTRIVYGKGYGKGYTHSGMFTDSRTGVVQMCGVGDETGLARVLHT